MITIFIPLKVIYRLNVISIEIPMTCFMELHIKIMKHERPQIVKATTTNRTLLAASPYNLKTYYRAIIKTTGHWNNNRHPAQCNRVEVPEMS
jgi:hypothetical protein